MSPTTFFLLVVNIDYAMFDTFGVIDATTQGGPAQATNILVYKVYMDGFVGLNLGSSSAQSVVLMVIVIVLTVDPVPLHRAAGAVLRHGREPPRSSTFLTHLVLILGVVIVVFPVYVAFIASTHGRRAISCAGMIPLLPGTHLVENYRTMLGAGHVHRPAPRRSG